MINFFDWGISHFSIQTDGLSWGWALLIGLAFTAISIWYYFRPGIDLPLLRRIELTVLRVLLLAIFAFLLTRPVLYTSLKGRVRGSLLVLIDISQSMNLKDNRTTPEDLNRAAIALGTLDPQGGLSQKLSDSDAKLATGLSRLELVQAVAANPKLNLWRKLDEKADLSFYGLGRSLTDLADPRKGTEAGQRLKLETASTFFKGIQANETGTALGDCLRSLLDQKQGEPVAGVLVITDGASNTGTPALNAAELARQYHIPLYIYGVGSTSPTDISVSDMEGPSVIQAKEKAVFSVQVKGLGVMGRHASVVLKAKGQQVDQKPISFTDEEFHRVQLTYVPSGVGPVTLEASVAPITGETVLTNNAATLRAHVVDQKLRVLLVDEYQSWDFQYLLAMLQRDRRIAPKVVLFDGDTGIASEANSPYLDTMPLTKVELYPYQIVILGDVDPNNLHENRMKMISQWVENAGGGLIFRAGPRFNPLGYRHTPLEPLVPVNLTGGQTSGLYSEPVHLALTPEGEVSPLLNLSDNPMTNLSLWKEFPGVFWTAWVGRARPGAQVLLTDPTAIRRNPSGPLPVMAVQSYGNGKCVYLGLRETYRWRSGKGEKYFTRVWSQLIQSLGTKTIGQSGTVRLKSDRPHYQVGDRISIAGTIYESSFDPSRDTTLTGTMRIQPDAAPNTPQPPAQAVDMRLVANADRPGEFSGEMIATVPGLYSFILPRDPASVVYFDVSLPVNLEQADTAMNAKVLQQMADTTNGRFVREEDLSKLPGWITSHPTTLTVDKKIDLIFSPWILVTMLALLGLEWLLRRLSKLK